MTDEVRRALLALPDGFIAAWLYCYAQPDIATGPWPPSTETIAAFIAHAANWYANATQFVAWPQTPDAAAVAALRAAVEASHD